MGLIQIPWGLAAILWSEPHCQECWMLCSRRAPFLPENAPRCTVTVCYLVLFRSGSVTFLYSPVMVTLQPSLSLYMGAVFFFLLLSCKKRCTKTETPTSVESSPCAQQPSLFCACHPKASKTYGKGWISLGAQLPVGILVNSGEWQLGGCTQSHWLCSLGEGTPVARDRSIEDCSRHL